MQKFQTPFQFLVTYHVYLSDTSVKIETRKMPYIFLSQNGVIEAGITFSRA